MNFYHNYLIPILLYPITFTIALIYRYRVRRKELEKEKSDEDKKINEESANTH